MKFTLNEILLIRHSIEVAIDDYKEIIEKDNIGKTLTEIYERQIAKSEALLNKINTTEL